MRGVTTTIVFDEFILDISTHTPHARRDVTHSYLCICLQIISTHTPHARRDYFFIVQRANLVISTHTPHARRDTTVENSRTAEGKFQLTRLMRGVTIFSAPFLLHASNFNSHASCEA